MNLNKNFVEIYDVFTNDYKLAERQQERRSPWGRCCNCNSFYKGKQSRKAELNQQLPNEEFEAFFEESDFENENLPPEDFQSDETKYVIKRQGNHRVDATQEQPAAFQDMSDAEPIDSFPSQPRAFPSQPVQPSIPSQPIQPSFPSQPVQPSIPVQPIPPLPPQPPLPPPPRPMPPPRPPRPFPPPPPRPLPPPPRPLPPPRPFPPQPPVGSRVVALVTQLFYELGNLQSLYSQLASFAPTESEAALLNSYANETLVLRGAMQEIHRTLTGRSLPSTSNRYLTPILTGVYCTDLNTTYNFAANINATLLQLIRIVDIASINRQLAIISATINNQLNGLNNLISTCI